MIGAPQVFHILTEFKFEIGHALLGSKTLTGAVDELSQAADNAMFSFQKMGMGIVAQMGLGTGGVLGVLHAAIEASEKFGATQRKIANIFVANPGNIAGGAVSLETALGASDAIMEKILHKSREFGLSAGAFADITTQVAAPMFATGVAGTNLDSAIEIARGVLKTAPMLGVSPGQAMNPIVDLINGRGSMNDQFTQRIVGDTQAFQAIVGGGGHGGKGGGSPLAAFNALNPEKRVKILTEALLQFGSNAKIVEMNAKSLTNQMQILRDNFIGMFSIFRHIGASLTEFLAPALARFNVMIQTNGEAISKQFGLMLKKTLGSPESMIENLFQAKSLRRDMDSASKVLSVAGITATVGAGLKYFGVITKAFSPWVSVLTGALTVFYDLWERTPTIATKVALVSLGVGALLAALVAFPPLAGILAITAGLTALFQLFSRAQGIAMVDDAKLMPQLTEDATRIVNAFMKTFGRLLDPFFRVFDGLAHLISPLFRVSGWIENLNNLLFKLVYMVSFVEAAFSGLLQMVSTFMQYFTSSEMISNPTGIFGAMGKSFSDEFDRVMDDNLSSLTDENNGAIKNQITNIGKVEIRNEFKEQLEPDRIAFTLKDQLMKTAQNPTQAARRSMSGALAGG